MGTGIGGQGGVVVVADAARVRCVPSADVAAVLEAAVTFTCSGLERPALDGAAPPVVAATLRLTSPGTATQLAARFVAERARRARATLVLRSYGHGFGHGFGDGTGALAPVAPIPAAELAAVAAGSGVLLPVGEPGALRYATTEATLVASRIGASALTARLLVGHRLFMGEAHCAGDAALVALAAGPSADGTADLSALRSALLFHEAAVVAALLTAAGSRRVV